MQHSNTKCSKHSWIHNTTHFPSSLANLTLGSAGVPTTLASGIVNNSSSFFLRSAVDVQLHIHPVVRHLIPDGSPGVHVLHLENHSRVLVQLFQFSFGFCLDNQAIHMYNCHSSLAILPCKNTCALANLSLIDVSKSFSA